MVSMRPASILDHQMILFGSFDEVVALGTGPNGWVRGDRVQSLLHVVYPEEK